MISGVLLDIAGVIYEGEKALPGALDAVDRLRHAGFSLRFVTNTTRMTKHMVLQRLARLGFGVTESELFTPAQGAREWLRWKRTLNEVLRVARASVRRSAKPR
jgi:ribonucleotide monophosphatase NagD (HAD superfamily)